MSCPAGRDLAEGLAHLGGKLLERMSDIDVKRAMKWLVTAIGAAMLLKAAGWL